MPLDRGGFGSALIALPVSIIFTSQVKILQNTTKNAYRRTKRRYARAYTITFVQALASKGNETALEHTFVFDMPC